MKAFERERWALTIVLLLALVVRVIFVLEMRSSPYFDHPEVDQGFFVEAGRAVASGHEILPGPLVRPPLYEWWLGAIFGAFGPGLLLPRLLQALVGTLTVWLVVRVATSAFDRRTGLLAGLFAATYWVLVYYDEELLRESLANPLNLAGVLLLVQTSRKLSWPIAAAAGLAWGSSALLRTQVLVVVPFLALWLFLHRRQRPSVVLAFLGAVALPILPVTIYNRVVGHDDVLVSADGGQVLWAGNNPDADGVAPVLQGQRNDFRGVNDDARRLAEHEEGRPLRPSEISRHYVQKTLAWVEARPAAALRLLVRKLRLFVTDWEFGNPEEPSFFVARFAPIAGWLPLGFGVAFALAALGFATQSRSELLSRFPIWGFVVLYGATVVAFLVSSRYREPILPCLLVYSARGATWLGETAFARRWVRAAAALAGCVVLIAATRASAEEKQDTKVNGLCWLGVAEGRAGRVDEARELFGQALAVSPGSCEARRGLGVSDLLAGRTEQGVADFQRALEACPRDLYVLDTLAELYLKQGRPDDAIPLARTSIEEAPHLHLGHYNLGRAYFEKDDLADAAAEFRSSMERKPDDFNAAYMLGVVCAALGRTDDAIEALERAVALGGARDDEFEYRAYGALVEVLDRSRREDEARRFASEMAWKFPRRAQAVALQDRR